MCGTVKDHVIQWSLILWVSVQMRNMITECSSSTCRAFHGVISPLNPLQGKTKWLGKQEEFLLAHTSNRNDYFF